MPNPGTITATQLARLSGLSERQLRRHAEDGILPRPNKNEYPLVPAIQGLLRYYRERERTAELQDDYDSLSACSAATGIPLALLKRAKRQGCPALRGERVQLEPFLRWWYAEGRTSEISYEQERTEQMVLQNHKLRLAVRRLKRELVSADEVSRLGAELGGAIRKVLTRLHRIAPSLAGQNVETIERRLQEEENALAAQLRIVDDRLNAWRQLK